MPGVLVYWVFVVEVDMPLMPAMTERRIKAIGTVTGANYGRLMREGFTAFNPIGALEAMAQQRTD